MFPQDLRKTVLLVEAVGRQKLVGGPEKDIADTFRPGMGDKRFEQLEGDVMFLAARGSGYEHLAQCGLIVADVLEAERADDCTVTLGNPELALARLVEVGNGGEIRLLVRADGDAEFLLLDRQDDRNHAGGVFGRERPNPDVAHGSVVQALVPPTVTWSIRRCGW